MRRRILRRLPPSVCSDVPPGVGLRDINSDA